MVMSFDPNDYDNKLIQLVIEFYCSENLRDWSGVRRRVSEEIVSATYPGGSEVAGRDDYVRAMIEMYDGRSSTFDILSIGCGCGENNVVFAEIIIEGKISINVFEVEDGLIRREREYLGKGY